MERDGRRSSLSFICPPGVLHVLPESFLHLPLWPIFRQSHPNFITVRTTYASKIWAQLTKNLLTKSGTERFRENILFWRCMLTPLGLRALLPGDVAACFSLHSLYIIFFYK